MLGAVTVILIGLAVAAIFVGEKFTKSGDGKDHKKGGDKGKH